MADTTVSTSSKWVASLGKFVTTTTIESLSAYPSVPADVFNVTKSFSDGVYRLTYDSDGDLSNGGGGGGGGGGSSQTWNYEVHTTTSSEPLKSFWKFASGQPWALDANAHKIIQNCENGTESWSKYTDPAAGSTGLAAYARLILKGQDSVLKPSITLSITADQTTLPSMSEIGKIATNLTNAPALPSGGNWILTGMNAVALIDGKWRVTQEYRASGQGGWEPTVYGTAN
jgi:hypothetical protein